jgi:CRISPR/Cas system-associated endonuclease Cas1
MAVNRRQVIPDSLAKKASPIQYVTENGFSIVRLSEVDKSVTATSRECRFLVRNERGRECEVSVAFEESLIAQIQNHRRSRLSDGSVLWLVCAEQRLATYLWENDDYPDGQLLIHELTADELLLATHWSDQRVD